MEAKVLESMNSMKMPYDPEDMDDFLAKVEKIDSIIRDLKDDKIDVDQVPKSLDELDGIREVSANRSSFPGGLSSPLGSAKANKDAPAGKPATSAQGQGQENDAPPPQQSQVAAPPHRGATSGQGGVRRSRVAPRNKGTTATDYRGWEDWGREVGDETDPADVAADVAAGGAPRVGSEASAFMASMEKDARARAEQRRKRIGESDRIKEEGNNLFRSDKYEEALDKYREAIRLTPDRPHLYANRAQAFIKVEKYEEAVADCTKALSIDGKFLKALYRRACALRHLSRPSPALADCMEVLRLAPENVEAQALRPILERDVRSEEEEIAAMKELEENRRAREATGKAKPDDTPLTAIDVLSRNLHAVGHNDVALSKIAGQIRRVLMRGVDTRAAVLLRVSKGLAKLMDALPLAPGPILSALAAACTNGRNVEVMVENRIMELAVGIIQILAEERDNEPSTGPAMEFIDLATSHEAGREGLAQISTAPYVFLRCLRHPDKAVRLRALGSLRSASAGVKFRERLRTNCGAVEAVSAFLAEDVNVEFRERAADTLMNMSLDDELRARMLASETVLPTIARILAAEVFAVRASAEWARRGRHLSLPPVVGAGSSETTVNAAQPTPHRTALLQAIVGCLGNCATPGSKGGGGTFGEHLREHNALEPLFEIFQNYEDFPSLVLLRAMLTLSRCGTHASVMQRLVKERSMRRLLEFAAGSDATLVEISTRLLASLSQVGASELILQAGGLRCLVDLLSSESSTVAGNAALCLSQCAQNDRAITAVQRQADTVPKLVRIMATQTGSTRKNAAIALARLCRESMIRDQVRELQGIEMMHTILQG